MDSRSPSSTRVGSSDSFLRVTAIGGMGCAGSLAMTNTIGWQICPGRGRQREVGSHHGAVADRTGRCSGRRFLWLSGRNRRMSRHWRRLAAPFRDTLPEDVLYFCWWIQREQALPAICGQRLIVAVECRNTAIKERLRIIGIQRQRIFKKRCDAAIDRAVRLRHQGFAEPDERLRVPGRLEFHRFFVGLDRTGEVAK